MRIRVPRRPSVVLVPRDLPANFHQGRPRESRTRARARTRPACTFLYFKDCRIVVLTVEGIDATPSATICSTWR